MGNSTGPQEVYLADGGNLENTGLIPALQRKIAKVVVFISSSVALLPRDRWDPSAPGGMRNLTESSIDDTVSGYFGVGPRFSSGYNYSYNQVFRSSEYAGVVNALQDAQDTGNGSGHSHAA